jgi:glutathione synthase/RimK-type ligase-like ATP-grasp enzyme
MPDVLLATDSNRPELWPDDLLLVEALERRRLTVGPAVWNDPAVDWGSARVVVLRSVFDYVKDRDAFCAWADHVEAVTPLLNAASTIRWNSHKAYLTELEAAGVPILPTAWIDAETSIDLVSFLGNRGWEDAVIKPSVGNGSRGAVRVVSVPPDAAQAHLETLLRNGDVMIQPYLPAAVDPGEHKLIHIDGRFSHAILENPRLDGRAFELDRIQRIDPEPEELALASTVLSFVPEPPLYARVDVVMDNGTARLMELEVIEPVLFFSKASGSADAMAAAIAAHL